MWRSEETSAGLSGVFDGIIDPKQAKHPSKNDISRWFSNRFEFDQTHTLIYRRWVFDRSFSTRNAESEKDSASQVSK